MKITTIGLDLAKHVFHLVGLDEHGKVVKKKMLRRSQLRTYFAQLPACRIGMEGCASSHYWARELMALGHQVDLIAAQHVKAFVCGNKNDYNDALAIAKAMGRPRLRRIEVKSIAQQDLQALHRLRQGHIKARTAHYNRIRGLLAEYGLILPQGVKSLRRCLPELIADQTNGLSAFLRTLAYDSYEQLLAMDEQVNKLDQHVRQHSAQDDTVRRLQTIPGFGPMVASVFLSFIGSGQSYRCGRDVAASLGLVPRQHSSGGKSMLLGISKRGDRYVRCQLVHGARAVVRAAAKKSDRLSCWIQKLCAQRGVNRATVALANKLARIGWAVVRHHTCYQPA